MASKNKLRPPSIAAIARKHGIRPGTLRDWRDREELDIFDEKALAARVERKQARVGTDPPPAENSARESYSEARRRREVAAANRMETIAAKERGELVEVHSIDADGYKIGYAIRSALAELSQQLPPALAGRTAGEVQKILKSEFRRALENLSHYQTSITFKP
jgi:transposase-like protein